MKRLIALISFVKNVFSPPKKGDQQNLDSVLSRVEVLRKKNIKDEEAFIEHSKNTGTQVSPWGLTLS